MHLLARGLYHLSLLVGVVSLAFLLFHVIPADPARVALGVNATVEQVASLRAELGLDRPLAAQFVSHLGRLARLDLGRSFVDRRAVWPEVAGKLQVSLTLLGVTLVLVVVYVGGVIALDRWAGGRVGASLDFVWISTPTMFSAVIIALLSGRYWPFSRFSGAGGLGDLLYLLPPAFVLALYPMATLSRLAAAELRRVGTAPYIRTVRALGVPETTVVGKYMLRNAVVPLLAGLANQLPILFTGAFVVEAVFSVPGLGSLLVRSLLQRDLPMLEGIVVVNTFVVLAVYVAAEAVYPLADPRIRRADAH